MDLSNEDIERIADKVVERLRARTQEVHYHFTPPVHTPTYPVYPRPWFTNVALG